MKFDGCFSYYCQTKHLHFINETQLINDVIQSVGTTCNSSCYYFCKFLNVFFWLTIPIQDRQIFDLFVDVASI